MKALGHVLNCTENMHCTWTSVALVSAASLIMALNSSYLAHGIEAGCLDVLQAALACCPLLTSQLGNIRRPAGLYVAAPCLSLVSAMQGGSPKFITGRGMQLQLKASRKVQGRCSGRQDMCS
jgi:hypothetical protein